MLITMEAHLKKVGGGLKRELQFYFLFQKSIYLSIYLKNRSPGKKITQLNKKNNNNHST